MTKRVFAPTGPDAFLREGLKEAPEAWEDGLRVDTGPGCFEWWYFDAHFDDGSTAVIVYMTKPLLERTGPLKPVVQVTITCPDGTRLSRSAMVDPGMFSSAKERCYVRCGESWARGNLHTYELHARAGDLLAQLTLTGIAPAWRPGIGKNYYDEDLTQYFGWLAPVPYGTVEGHLTYDGKIHTVKGTCYHDHNWGNVSLNDVLSHWYWGRAQIGDYTLIFVEMHAAEAYGGQKLPVFLLARGSQILTGDGEPLRLEIDEIVQHRGGRSYPRKLDFDWKNPTDKGVDCIHLALRNPAIIEATSLLVYLPRWKQWLARLVANPYYFRFNAELELSIQLGMEQVFQKGKALFEIMMLK
jgi:hypothetical protein